MKFRAVVSGNETMVMHVLQALQKLDRTAERKTDRRGAFATVVLKLSPETFALVHQGGVEEGSQTWSHFNPPRLFEEYRIESRRNNKIDLEAPIGNLLHLFTCAAEAGGKTSIRLYNGPNNQPVLTFESSLQGKAVSHKVNQEVPVRVIAEAEAEQICEPHLPEPDYQLELPSQLGRLRNVLEKMRNMGAQHVLLEAAKEKPSGDTVRLRLTAETDLIEVSTTFSNLMLLLEGKKEPSPEGPLQLALSLRRFGEVLGAVERLAASSHIACVIKDKALVLYALLPQNLGSVISYTPVIDM